MKFIRYQRYFTLIMALAMIFAITVPAMAGGRQEKRAYNEAYDVAIANDYDPLIADVYADSYARAIVDGKSEDEAYAEAEEYVIAYAYALADGTSVAVIDGILSEDDAFTFAIDYADAYLEAIRDGNSESDSIEIAADYARQQADQ